MERMAIAASGTLGSLMTRRPQATAIAVTGPPASGKSTAVSKLLATHASIRHFKVRLHFQSLLSQGHPVAVALKAQLDARERLSDRTVAWGFDDFIVSQGDATYLLVEGYPRDASQFSDMRAVAEEHGVSLGGLVIFDAPTAVLRERARDRVACFKCDSTATCAAALACPRCGGALTGRPDDSPGRLAERISQFRQARRPMEEMFSRYGTVVTLDAQRPPDELATQLELFLARVGGVGFRHE
jgi:adenylate kinase